MQTHDIVSREQWIAARKALLAHEKRLTRARDQLSAERRALPWVRIDKTYSFHYSHWMLQAPFPACGAGLG
jgi:predicted dithiol-disulfide oxidoreductase (DUF899 family)